MIKINQNRNKKERGEGTNQAHAKLLKAKGNQDYVLQKFIKNKT